MEIQQSLKLTIHKKWPSSPKKPPKETEPITTTPTTPKLKWKKIFFQTKTKTQTQTPPEEFLCPISHSLMFDPVIVSSGHSFERSSVEACKNVNFTPQLPDGTTPDFSTLIPNLALKSAILKWCQSTHTPTPSTPQQQQQPPRTNLNLLEPKPRTHLKPPEPKPVKNLCHHAETEVPIRPTHLYTSSEESIATTSASTPPLQLSTRPSCCYYSSPSSSELEPATTPEEEEIMTKLKNPQHSVIEEALISLRKLTRIREETRLQLCTPRLLSALRSLVLSKHVNVQVNALASVVNLSLEKSNKVRIVRSGMVPPLIEVLKFGSSEAQEHGAGALFSLAMDDDNKTAIGVLGGLAPLLHMLRSESERTRHDSALALYHLSLVQSNRSKMVKLGSVPVLLSMEEDVDWEELLDSGLGCRTRSRLGGGLDESSANSAEF
ncbi:U-box domain-containing protein 40 [Glycine soja]|uniref:RING-type E3 ubiquitin transferase n=1 Tax=Glycine soja TaxID=3848 RepID=A0A0B2Q988_GLYSO|nr:U-box domain-containing protein 40 [Glycine soja]